jgi:hypothetical protein
VVVEGQGQRDATRQRASSLMGSPRRQRRGIRFNPIDVATAVCYGA